MKKLLLAGLASLALLAGCAQPNGNTNNPGTNPGGSGGNGGVAVTGVSLNQTRFTVTGTQQILATVSPFNAANTTVTWSSSNSYIASVSATGLVTAVGTGTAVITATTADGAKTATAIADVNGYYIDFAAKGTVSGYTVTGSNNPPGWNDPIPQVTPESWMFPAALFTGGAVKNTIADDTRGGWGNAIGIFVNNAAPATFGGIGAWKYVTLTGSFPYLKSVAFYGNFNSNWSGSTTALALTPTQQSAASTTIGCDLSLSTSPLVASGTSGSGYTGFLQGRMDLNPSDEGRAAAALATGVTLFTLQGITVYSAKPIDAP